METKGTVYVPQEVFYRNENGDLVPKFQMYPAERFGEIKVLLPYGKVALAPQPMINKLRHQLKDFTDSDYILPTGDPIAIAAAISVAGSFNRGRVKVLRWLGKERKYIVVKINLSGGHYAD